jgi:hypothetical protein
MTITVKLSSSGLESAAKQLRKYAESLNDKSEKLVRELCSVGVDNAIGELLHHIDTGETINSIQYEHNGKSGRIVAGGNAVWIEFGTGVRYNGAVGSYAHEKAAELGMSPIGCYGQGNGANENGWWYIGKDGKRHHTFGIASTPFMYNTSKELRRELKDIAKDVFRID